MSIHPGPKVFGHIHVKSVCDECGRARSSGNHQKCSKRRQVRTAAQGAANAEASKRYSSLTSYASNE
jgi:hypothetical protein